MSRRALVLVGIALVVVVAFWPCLANAPVMDDSALTVKNRYLASFDGFSTLFSADIWTTSEKEEASAFYRPIAMVSYMLNKDVGGSSPVSFHLGNVALHAGNAVLLASLMQRLAGVRLISATICALGFALAPLNVETVTSLTGRFDLLGVTLLLFALVANASAESRYGCVPLVFLALLSKEAFVASAVLIATVDLAILGRTARSEALKWGLLALSVVVVLAMRRAAGVTSMASYAATPVGMLPAALAFLLATFGRQLVWPSHLDPLRPYAAPGALAITLVLAIALSALAFAAVSVRRAPHDPRKSLVLVGTLWTLVALAPVAAVVANVETVGDVYAYFPLVGVFLALAALLDTTIDVAPKAPAIAASVATLGLFAAGARDRVRLEEWKDEATLFAASVRGDPKNAYAVTSLGRLATVEGRFAEAETLLLQSDALRPGSWRTESALCAVWLHQDQLPKAERACLASADHRPDDARVWMDLVSVYVRAKMWTRCLEIVPKAIAHKPRSAEPVYQRAVCRANLHDFAGAIEDARTALSRDPRHRRARDLLAQLREQGGK